MDVWVNICDVLWTVHVYVSHAGIAISPSSFRTFWGRYASSDLAPGDSAKPPAQRIPLIFPPAGRLLVLDPYSIYPSIS
jgi:hypothetical protein